MIRLEWISSVYWDHPLAWSETKRNETKRNETKRNGTRLVLALALFNVYNGEVQEVDRGSSAAVDL